MFTFLRNIGKSGGEEKGGYERGKDYNHSGYTDLVHWIINNCYIKLMILQLQACLSIFIFPVINYALG